jgi:UDP-GlcNAc:undecaprenyl-phosphate GlcNAc-1-phosphate transferase
MVSEGSIWLSAAASLAVTIAAMIALRPIAQIVDLVDRPGGRKMHSGEIPVVGGLAMLLGVVFGLSTIPAASSSLSAFLLSATLLVIVGLLDDRFNLSPTMRLIAQFAAVLPMVFGASVYLRTFGDVLGIGALDTGRAYLVITALFTIAAINAFNMLDGLDGLAGGLAMSALAFMISLMTGAESVHLLLAVTICGAIAGFLFFNLPVQFNRRFRCFMGDAGSTLLGFSVAWTALAASQGASAGAVPVTMLWFVIVPATDLVWTVVRRLARGQSPLRADSEHLHHSLLRLGLGVRAVFIVMIAYAILAGLAGLMIAAAGAPEWLSLMGAGVAGVSFVVLCRRGRFLAALLPAALLRADVRLGESTPAAGSTGD